MPSARPTRKRTITDHIWVRQPQAGVPESLEFKEPIMATVTGQATFVITEEATGEEERQTIQANEFNIECEQTDSEDDKLR